jgi:hypothetical protein
MLVQMRSVAVRVAVLCFFAISIVGSLCGLAPYTCCKRALLGAGAAYLGAGAVVRAINAILTQAMIADQVDKSKEDLGDSQGQKPF